MILVTMRTCVFNKGYSRTRSDSGCWPGPLCLYDRGSAEHSGLCMPHPSGGHGGPNSDNRMCQEREVSLLSGTRDIKILWEKGALQIE